ncbi:hypothetical protein, partial [Clostridium haemolyticum]
MNKKFIKSMSLFVLAFVLFTTSATPAFASMKCVSNKKIYYYDPIANERETNYNIAMKTISILMSYGVSENVGKIVTLLISGMDWVKIAKETPNEKPVK